MEIKMLKKKVSPSQSAFEDNQHLKYHNQLQQKHENQGEKGVTLDTEYQRELCSAVMALYIIWEYRIFIVFEKERERLSSLASSKVQ